MDDVNSFLNTLYEEVSNEELWEVWLAMQSNPFNSEELSFKAWKAKLYRENAMTKESIEREAETGMNRALDMLNKVGGGTGGS